MRRQRRSLKLLALIMGLSLVAAACGSDDDGESGDSESEGAAQEEGVQGGELVDLGTFAQGPPEHIDPSINTTSDGWQVGGSLYDGLAETDFSDPENPETVGVVAESWEVNDDATEFVFTIREDLTFSTGEPVLLGLTLAVVLAYAFVNLVVDVSYAWFDPRIRLGKGEHG